MLLGLTVCASETNHADDNVAGAIGMGGETASVDTAGGAVSLACGASMCRMLSSRRLFVRRQA